jgi:hypothetical protein
VQDLITARLNQVREELEHLATIDGLLTEWLNDASLASKKLLEGAIEDGGFTLTKIEMPQ